jgi:polyhydroxybutyrate depolymerase
MIARCSIHLRPVTSAMAIVAAATCLMAATMLAPTAPGEGTRRTWTIEGTERQAIVHLPSGAPRPCPLILAFHGHGGSAQRVSRSMHLQGEWPGAVVVYAQGLPTKSQRVDPEGRKPGWQNRAGEYGDRDLKLVDAIVESLRNEGWVDDTRVYATGHSNGAGFTYALWLARPELLAAVAPVAGGSLAARQLQPMPCMHIAGRADSIVPFAGQERVMDVVRQVNGCEGTGKPWATDCTRWESPLGTPFVGMVTDGGHQYPAEAPALIVRFLREHSAWIPFGPPAPGERWPRAIRARRAK